MQLQDELIIDPDVSALFLPEESSHIKVIRENIRIGVPPAPFPVWNRILLDRLQEYREYTDAGYEIKTQSFYFSSRNTMLASICQLLATDIPKTTAYKAYLIGKQYQYHKIAYFGNEIESSTGHISLKELKEKYTRDIHPCVVDMVNLYDVASGTIHFYSRFAASIDAIKEKSPELATLILTDRVHIPKKKVLKLGLLSSQDLENLLSKIKSDNLQKVPDSILSGNHPAHIDKKDLHLDNRIIPEIKQMPKYDPDADVSSLALTIPSWSDSIRRVRTRTDMSAVTPGAADRLIFQLGILERNIQIIKHELEGITEDA